MSDRPAIGDLLLNLKDLNHADLENGVHVQISDAVMSALQEYRLEAEWRSATGHAIRELNEELDKISSHYGHLIAKARGE